MTLNMADAAPFLDRLKRLYDEMDAAYRAAAEHYGFQCDGCTDNCCLTRFHHHTHLEYLYLREGFRAMPMDAQTEVRALADAVIRETAATEKEGGEIRIMCPLNTGGRCRLYSRRPMICRLHGVAHELHLPGRPVSRGPGCALFMQQAEGAEYFRFDRTPFYREMAMLESGLKQAAGLSTKLKMTVAEMIVTFEEPAL